MASSLVLFVRIVTPWMYSSSCRYLWSPFCCLSLCLMIRTTFFNYIWHIVHMSNTISFLILLRLNSYFVFSSSIDMAWQEPVLPGCFLRAKAIGLMPMIDQVHFRTRIIFWILVIKLSSNLFMNTGRKRWQDNCCLCWWSWVPPLQWYQGASTTSFGWDPSLLWRLYPYFI